MTGKERLDQIERGLDWVTGGKWCQFHPHYCEDAIGTSFSDWDTSHDLSAVHDGKRRRIASFKHADDAAHVDRCSPDAIREIAAYVRELEEKLGTANALVTCCCGSPVDTHGMGDGHSPVDMYHYDRMQQEARIADLEERLAKAAEALEKFTGHYEPWMDRWADGDESSTFSRHTFGQLRSARAIISQIRSEK